MTRRTSEQIKQEKSFSIFESECIKWIDELGLKNWEIHILTEELQDVACGAMTTYEYEAKLATISLNKIHTNESEYTLRRWAFHEVCEVLLAGVNHIAMSRDFNGVNLTSETHNVIHILENALFDRTII